MLNNKIFKWLSIAVVAAVFILLAVFVLSKCGGRRSQSEGEIPELSAGEKLPNSLYGNFYYSGPPPFPEFELDEPFPKIPEKMMIYKIIPPKQLTEEDAYHIAEKYFDMPSDAVFRKSNLSYRLKTKTHLFNVYHTTGFFSFNKFEEYWEKHSRDRKDFPSDEQCQKIATEYLESRGLLPDNASSGKVTNNISSGKMSVGFGMVINGYRSY